MEVFWDRGYEAASLSQLLEAMGIARGSLYKAFTDKRSIYLATLDLYDRSQIQVGASMLADPSQGDGVSRLERFLLYPADAVRIDNDRRGCFLCNAAVDMAPRDKDVEGLVLGMMDRLRAAISQALKDTPVGAEMTAGYSQRVSAALLTAYMGLRVMAKAGTSYTALSTIAQTTLNAFGLSSSPAASG